MPQARNVLLYPVGKPPPATEPTMQEEDLDYDNGGLDLPNKGERVYALLGPGATAYGIAAVIEPYVNCTARARSRPKTAPDAPAAQPAAAPANASAADQPAPKPVFSWASQPLSIKLLRRPLESAQCQGRFKTHPPVRVSRKPWGGGRRTE